MTIVTDTAEHFAYKWLAQRKHVQQMAPGCTVEHAGLVAAILVAAQFIGDSVPDVGVDGPLDVRLTDGWPR